ncbi:MAG: TonB-dependent receptor [Acidobacteriaceae bacterium]
MSSPEAFHGEGRSKPARRLLMLLALAIVGCTAAAMGQELQATLTGTVTDASGAVIPQAEVTVTQSEGKGLIRSVTTNAAGSYTVTNLPPGTYTVKITAQGFTSFVAQNVTLFVAQTRSVDAKLQPGSVNQTVVVQQNAVALDTTTSELSGTISGTQVRELQLNNRNFMQLVTLQPGVVSNMPAVNGFGAGSNSAISVNGARTTGNNWTIDGADDQDSGSNGNILNVPSIDAIQEFTMERSNYDAEYGRSGAGQVLVATKSGTSSFHGDVYEFDRNTLFNANSYFNNNAGLPRAAEHYNDYGFTLGGPLYIPKHYNTARNKTFFFWSEEWRKESLPTTTTSLTPSMSELSGVFPGTVSDAQAGCATYDAATNQTTLNPSCYSTNAMVYLKGVYDLFPPNSGPNVNITSYSELNNYREDLVRADANLNDRMHLFVRWMQDIVPIGNELGLFTTANFPGPANTLENTPGINLVGNLTWTITPRIVNETEFAYTQGEIHSSYLPGAFIDSATVAQALTGQTAYPDPYGRNPGISFTGSVIQGVTPGDTPYRERNLDRTLFDNFSLVHGNHNLRLGASIQQMLKNQNTGNGDSSFRFNSFSDFLLGNVATYTQLNRDIIPDLQYYNIEGYVQDDWQLTHDLTLNLGLRYSYFPSPSDANHVLQNFDPDLFVASDAPALNPTNGTFVAGQAEIPATYTNGIIFPAGSSCTQAQAIAAQVSCSPFGSHVNPDPKKDFAPRVGFAYAPSRYSKIAIHGGAGLFFDRVLSGIWNQNAFQDPPLAQSTTVNNTSFDNPLQGTKGVSLTPNHVVSTGTPAMSTPYYVDYNLSVQEQVARNTVAELGYVGTVGRHLLGEVDLNQPTLAARAANPTANALAILPYPGYNWFASRIAESMSDYNALQVSVNHRTQHGLTLGVAYTWAKNLTDQSNDRATAIYDTYDSHKDYGPSSFNQPQVFIANYVYDLPFFRTQSGVAGHALGGWEVSGLVSAHSGFSQTIRQESDNFDCVTDASAPNGCAPGTYPNGLNMGPGDIAPRPDRTAPISMVKSKSEWFSTNSFTDAVGHFGDSGNGVLLGPGYIDFDIAAIRNVTFERRYRLQFRGEFFNAFNHTNFTTIGVNTDQAAYGRVTAAADPREIQLGGKFYF